MSKGRPPAAVPPYPNKPHSSGSARLRYRGREIYLGKWGSPESKVKYARIVAELHVSGQIPSASHVGQATLRTTVAELINVFRVWAKARYVKNDRPTTEIQMFQAALAPVLHLYGDVAANDFGPLALTACRDELKQRGHCRQKINEHLGRIRRVWKFGVSREMVAETTWRALGAVEGLRRGQAYDPPPVTCAPAYMIAAIEQHVLPPIWAMVQLQLWTGLRPGEVVQMRTCDVRRDDPAVPTSFAGKLWVYRPASHKTQHHEKQRVIFLGPQAQEILLPWLKPDQPEAFLFSPGEATNYRHAKRSQDRQTPGRSKYVKRRVVKKRPGEAYTVHAYGNAIQKGCERGMNMPEEIRVPKRRKISAEEKVKRLALAREWRKTNTWSPNQLRHNAATLIRQRYGVEVARIILGHASISTTEVYAELDFEKAAKAMAETG